MKIPIGSDHAGFKAKQKAIEILESLGYEVDDMGTYSEDSVDYPDFAAKVAESVQNGTYPQGILICGSGEGVCITANKFDGIRAGLAFNAEVARLIKEHNNANIMCLPGRYVSEQDIEEMLTAWLNASFEGGRHQRRVEKIHSLTHH